MIWNTIHICHVIKNLVAPVMKTFFRVSGALVLSLMLAGVIIFITHPRIPLGILAAPLSSVLSTFTKKTIHLEGQCYLTPGKWLKVEIEYGKFEISEKNESLFAIRAAAAETKVNIPALLRKEIFLGGVKSRGLHIEIDKNVEKTDEESPGNQPAKNNSSTYSVVKQTGNIDLSDTKISIIQARPKPPTTIQLDHVKGEFSSHTAGSLTLRGTINNFHVRDWPP